MMNLLTALTAIDIPDVQPDFNAPFMTGLWQIVSWVLAAAMALALLALIVAIVGVAFKGLGNSRYQEMAGANLIPVLLAVIALGSASGIFQFFIGFDLGF